MVKQTRSLNKIGLQIGSVTGLQKATAFYLLAA
jgi:hypothetical protein